MSAIDARQIAFVRSAFDGYGVSDRTCDSMDSKNQFMRWEIARTDRLPSELCHAGPTDPMCPMHVPVSNSNDPKSGSTENDIEGGLFPEAENPGPSDSSSIVVRGRWRGMIEASCDQFGAHDGWSGRVFESLQSDRMENWPRLNSVMATSLHMSEYDIV